MTYCKSSGGARGWRRALLLFFFLALVAAGPAVPDASARAPIFTLRALDAGPDATYFVFGSRPGATIKGAVRVVNEGDEAGPVRLYGVDAVTGETTGAVYRSRQDPRDDVGAWVSLPIHQLELAPGQSRVVPFRVEVPAGARPGHHLGGIVAENATLKTANRRKTGRGSFRIDVRNLSIVAVQVNLPGTRDEQLQLTSVEAGPAEGFQTLLIGMRNQGNRLLKGTGSLEISDESGERLKRGTFNVDTFVPRTSVAYPFVVPGEALPDGRYHAAIAVRYGRDHVARLSTWFTISDEQIEQVFGSDPQGPAAGDSSSILWLLLAALAALLLGLAAWALWRRRGNRTPISPIYITAVHMPEGSSHEQIELVQWQNPQTLEAGQATREGIVEWINSGGDLRVRNHAGDRRVGVVAADPPYICTHADGVWTGDLLAVPRY